MYVPFTGSVATNDTDADGDTLSFTLGWYDPALGSINVQPNGNFEFVPVPGFRGDFNFNYTVSDGRNGSSMGNVTINVQPDIVDAANNYYSTAIGTQIVDNVSWNDWDPVQSASLTYALVPGSEPDVATKGSL